jgi:precorrin-2 dehydrogenase / sirohydrochlorin ferrochelatase
MLPITVDLADLAVILAGNGAAACRRLALLDEAGAAALDVYAPEASPALAELAGARLRRRWPRSAEIARARFVFLAGVPDPAVAAIVAAARRSRALVNVEDDARRCDFHSAAVLRRGDLTVAISTNGRSPGLAALLRRMLEPLFGPEWEAQTNEIAALRRCWRSAGADGVTIDRWTGVWASRHALWQRREGAAAGPSLARSRRIP